MKEMPYVASIYKFANPEKSSYRLHYISEPFFNDDLEQELKRPYKDIYKKIKTNVKEKRRAVLPLEHYRRSHEILVENLQKLKGHDIIISPGFSANLTEEENILGERPASMGMDYFSNNIRLPDDILNAYKIAFGKYMKNTGKAPKNYEHEILIPWAHVIMPLRILRRRDGVFGLEAFFRGELEKITEERKSEGKIGFGTLVRWTDTSAEEHTMKGIRGNYESSERIFLGTSRESMPYAYLNCFNSARSKLKILQACGKAYWFDLKSKSQGKINERLPPEYRKKLIPVGGDEGIMRNTVLSRLGASDKTAIDILAGLLYRKWMQENNDDVRPKRLGAKNAKLFA